MADNTFKIPNVAELIAQKKQEETEPQSAVTAQAANPFNSPLANPFDGLNAKNEYYIPVSNVKANAFGEGEQCVPVMVRGADGHTTTVYKTPEEMKEYNRQKQAKAEALKRQAEEAKLQAEHEALVKEQEAILAEEQKQAQEKAQAEAREQAREQALKEQIYAKAEQKVIAEAKEKAQNKVNVVEENVDITENIDENINAEDSQTLEVNDYKPVCYVSPHVKKAYHVPPISLLDITIDTTQEDNSGAENQKTIIDNEFASQHFGAHVENYVVGPTVTQFQIVTDPGVRVDGVASFEKTLQMKLAAESIRILSPVPGHNYIGIEIPSAVRKTVKLGELLSRDDILNDHNPFRIPLGKDASGKIVCINFLKLPHLLIAGQTGSGKSVCLNALLCSLIYKATPEDIKLLIIDPKRNEFLQYSHIPHLACRIITELDEAIAIFNWLVQEMDNRSKLFHATEARDIDRYNQLCKRNTTLGTLPHIIVVFDEYGDYITRASKDFETQVLLIGQKARSYGIHLILATQRPSTDIISGPIKNNMTHTICFKTKDYVSSNTIIGHAGAEKLLGNGDMIFVDNNETRIQGAFLDDDEIDAVTQYVSTHNDEPNFMTDVDSLKQKTQEKEENAIIYTKEFVDVATYAVRNKCASSNKIQQVFGMGFNKVNMILGGMEAKGIISSTVPGKQRDVLIDSDQLDQLFDELGVLH